MYWNGYEIDEDDYRIQAAEDQRRRRHSNWLLCHPHPQDPDHPGQQFDNEEDDSG